MGLLEATEDIIKGVILLIVIATIMVALWPSLVPYLGNGEVFPIGLVTLGILGMIPLVWVIGLLMKIFKEMRGKAENIGFPRQRPEEFE